MQPDFQKTMIVVIGVCAAIFGIGGTLLFLAFRAFGTARRGGVKHIVLLVAAIGFTLVCSVALLIWSTVVK